MSRMLLCPGRPLQVLVLASDLFQPDLARMTDHHPPAREPGLHPLAMLHAER